MPKPKNSLASGSLIMKSVIICDDLALVAKACVTLQRVGSQPDVNAQWIVKSWPTNFLKPSATAENTLVEAADAHLIVIPAQYAHSLPFWISEWLERWAELRQVRDAALAVIDDGIDPGFTRTVSPELTRLVRKHGLNFINADGAVAKDAARLIMEYSHEPELPLPVERSLVAYAVTGDSFRGVGINE